MNTPGSIDIDSIRAVDVHVHIEHSGEDSAADQAAKKYFGNSGASRDRRALADYYRLRKIACVVFTVDETLTGRPQVSNESVAEFAAENSDIAIAFASINPHRGKQGVEEARKLLATGRIRGLKLHPPSSNSLPMTRLRILFTKFSLKRDSR